MSMSALLARGLTMYPRVPGSHFPISDKYCDDTLVYESRTFLSTGLMSITGVPSMASIGPIRRRA